MFKMRKKENMRVRKYGCILIVMSLIGFTVLLSVKHEQKRLREEVSLQEEKSSEEIAVKEAEETVNAESDEIIEQGESEGEKEEILYDHTLLGRMWMYYEAEEIPFVDDETFVLIREAYEEVEYSAEFEKGNSEDYEIYKQKFWCLLQNEIPFMDRKTDEEIYIKDWTDSKGKTMVNDIKSCPYYFFDMNGDSFPELCIDNYGQISVFAYDSDRDQCVLWTRIIGMNIVGTCKGMWTPDYDVDIYEFFQLNPNGDLELDTLFWAEHADLYHDDINMVMFPNYADTTKRWKITEEMKRQGVLEESSGQWFFRITDEQFKELERPYREAREQARDRMREEGYTYEELFGEYETE